MLVNEARSFREVCQKNGIAVTHQRQVLYEVMKTMHGHPSPEEVYAQVKKRVPVISLATVYKNLHLFVESDVFREVSMIMARCGVEMNDES
jgi:Fur family transcriptional regulator, peroxide stress response regulator